ncbi:hypothetical protein SAMN05421641_12039 [Paracoccus thiocyanatus]|uniref:Uncharacterized protein n=1 Tax=Paracoccus thiocyanatus TaxID=34006 RepID=A0A1N6XB76_9RHOB|nr:hypothetical protein SAMN05421641_12039 [Paracoccus thiocyanatus]
MSTILKSTLSSATRLPGRSGGESPSRPGRGGQIRWWHLLRLHGAEATQYPRQAYPRRPRDRAAQSRRSSAASSATSPSASAQDLNDEGLPSPAGHRARAASARQRAVNNDIYGPYRLEPHAPGRGSPHRQAGLAHAPGIGMDDHRGARVPHRQANPLGYGETGRWRSPRNTSTSPGDAQAHRNNRLNAAHRPKSLPSGLVFCGCCGDP